MVKYNEMYTQHLMDKYGVNWFKLNEPSGNVTDSKGTAVGAVAGATRVVGVSGNALSFNGTNNYVQFDSAVFPTGKISVRLRLKMSSKPVELNSELLSNVFATTGRGLRSWIDTDGNLAFRGIIASSGNYNFSATVPFIFDSQWHDILFTWDGTTNAGGVKLYIDDMITPKSIEKASVANSYIGSFNLVLGRAADRAERYLNAQVDEIEIYNEVIEPIPPASNKILLLSGDNKAISYKANMINHITNMTSNSASSVSSLYRVASSTLFNSIYPSWFAFRGDGGATSALLGGNTGWLEINYSMEKRVSKVAITANKDYSNAHPKDFDVEGSNDGTAWENIKSFRNQTWNLSQTRVFELGKVYDYSRYRIRVINNGGNASYTAIGEILFSGKYERFAQTPSKSGQSFINHGMSQSDLSSIDMSADFTEKYYIQDEATVLGEGKVFEQVLDVNKVLKKVSIK